MEEKKKFEEIKQKIAEIDLSDNDDYGVYNFFKSHPGILITFLSAIVAVLGFINRTIQYSNFSDYLNYWGWENINVEGTPGSISYTLAFSFLNLGIIVLTGVAFFKYIDQHFKVIFMVNEIRRINREAVDSGHLIANEVKAIALRIFATFIVVWALYVLDFALFYHYSIQFQTILIALVFAVVVVGIFTVFCATYTHTEVRKQIAAGMKDADSKTKKAMDMLTDYISRSGDGSMIQLINNFSLRTMFSKKSVMCVLIAVIMILFASVMTSSVVIPDTIDKRDFAIMTVDGEDYMVVYNNNRTYYLNRVDMRDNVLYVYTDDHKIVYDDAADIKDMYFTWVEKV